MTIEDRLRQALADQADAVGAPPDRWHEVEARARAQRAENRRRVWWRAGGLTVIGVAAAVVALIALPALGHESPGRVVTRPAGHPAPSAGSPTSASPATTAPPAPATGASPRPIGTTSTTSGPGSASGSSYLPLYPFRSLQDVVSWQGNYRSSGQQPWHLDPGLTALSFTNFLGYTNIDTVIGTRMDAAGAHVSVGFNNPNGQPVTAAVVHLVRFGTGNVAPWEVVGTDDTDFSTTTPRYGAVVTAPMSVGGLITGVDESIKVQVLQQSSQPPLGQFCCLAAGGTARPWNASVSFQGATDNVLIVAASTGGHLAAVERFTITGVRTRPGQSTPGL